MNRVQNVPQSKLNYSISLNSAVIFPDDEIISEMIIN